MYKLYNWNPGGSNLFLLMACKGFKKPIKQLITNTAECRFTIKLNVFVKRACLSEVTET